MSTPTLEIEKIELRMVEVPMHEPFRIANGEVGSRPSIILAVTASGVTGYGESAPMPGGFYSGETPESVWDVLVQSLLPEVLGSSIRSAVSFAHNLNHSPYDSFSKAGIEGAVWDLQAKQLQTNIGSLLSIKPAPIESGAAIGMYGDIATLLERVEHFLAAGYKRMKIKIQPDWDAGPLAAIRERFGNIPLMADANGSYSLPSDQNALRALDEFDLMMIEQPLAKEDLEGHALLTKELRTPICLDESISDLNALRAVIMMTAAHIVNIKVQRMGGLWNALEAAKLAGEAGLGVWLGTMPELGIASAQALQIASHPAFTYPTDIEASERWYEQDIISPAIDILDGLITPASGDGFGYGVDMTALEKYTTNLVVLNR